MDSTLRAQTSPLERQPLKAPIAPPKASTRRRNERRETRAREQLVATWLRSLSAR